MKSAREGGKATLLAMITAGRLMTAPGSEGRFVAAFRVSKTPGDTNPGQNAVTASPSRRTLSDSLPKQHHAC